MARKPKEEIKEEKEKTTKRVKKKENNKKELAEEEKVVVVEKEVDNNKFGIWEVIVVALVSIVFGLLLGSLIVSSKYKTKKDVSNMDEIKYVYESILKDYYGEITENDLFNGAIRGMIDSLGDKYALFLSEQDALSFNQELNGNFVGLGVMVGVTLDGRIQVTSVFEDSPADKAGILPNDYIVKMDGVSYDAENYSDMIYNIQTSKIGTEKEFEIIRDDETITIKVTLDKVELSTVSTALGFDDEDPNKKVGVIRIGSFSANTYSQFLEKYKTLKEENISALVIDVRDNGGGYLSTANQISSLFLDKGTVLYKKSDGKNVEEILNEKVKTIDVPVVIVINENTASSAEVFAACLKENLDVDIVGVNSYGKGSVQKFVPLINGSYIKYTVLEWLTPNGNSIEGVGVEPTIRVELAPNSDVDKQLEKAIEVALEK